MRAGSAILLACLSLAACRQDMTRQPSLRPLEPSAIWANGTSARPLPDGTVAQDDAPPSAPPTVDVALVTEGRRTYDTFCSPCHGFTGAGDGMIVRHGFPKPPSYHSPRLRAASAEHLVDVIAHGYGAMYAYGDRVDARQRWAVAAYIRALQIAAAPPSSPDPASGAKP
jgi:mono/diheme cytochrome c family protein